MSFSDNLLDACGKPAYGKPSRDSILRVWALITFADDGTAVVTARAATTDGWTVVSRHGLRLKAPDGKAWRLVADLVQRSTSRDEAPTAATGHLYRYDDDAVSAIAQAAALDAALPEPLAWFGQLASGAWTDGWDLYRERCRFDAHGDRARAQRLFADHWLEFYWALEGALVVVTGARPAPYALAVSEALDAVLLAA
jgi:hypothetical protein